MRSRSFAARSTAFRWPRPRPASGALRGTTPGAGRHRRHRHGAANQAAAEADLVIGVRHPPAGLHHRLARAVRQSRRSRIAGLNVQPFDAAKHGALPLVADARRVLL
jgi:hypothetical protein